MSDQKNGRRRLNGWTAIHYTVALLITVLAALTLLHVDRMESHERGQEVRADIRTRLDAIRVKLEAGIVGPLLRTRGITAQIAVHGDPTPDEFARLVAILLEGNRNVINMALSHGTVIGMVYPLKGNESILGVDYRTVAHQWPTVSRAIESRNPLLQGPVTLIQGYSGLIVRAPVFVPDPKGGEPSFFGIVSVVLNVDGLLTDAGLKQPDLPIRIAIRGRDGLGAAGEVFFGDAAIFAQDPVEMDIVLPYGSWRMAAVPKISADADWTMEVTSRRALAVLLLLLIAAAAFGTAHHMAVQKEVAERRRIEQELLHARNLAEVSNRAKTELLANMSHELRTPLNAIIGFSEIIQLQALGAENPKYSEYIDDIMASGRHLLDLINDILDLSAVEAGKMELRESTVALAGLMESAIRLVAPKAAAGELSLTWNVMPPGLGLVADERRLKQVLLNLLSNAVKFTPPGGTVSLSAGMGEEGSCLIRITDSGIGMDEAGIAKAMSLYGQVADPYVRHQDGTGLGLPLACRLTEAHGGRLGITSRIGQGTTVTLTFPADRCRLP
jgi:two-component system sensor histidine kinase ChiS